MNIKWSDESHNQSMQQGWLLSFQTGRDNAPDQYAIEKYDEDTPFQYDDDALLWVKWRAAKGCPLCGLALIFIEEKNKELGIAVPEV